MAPASQRRKRPTRITDYDVTLSPYLGTSPVIAGLVKEGSVRQFRRPEGAELVAFQQAALHRWAEAKRRLPGMLEEIRTCALAADPLLLYSRLTVLSGIRRAAPGPASFGMDATLEFYAGLVTAMPADGVVSRIGVECDPQVLFDLDHLLREYAIAENQIQEGHALQEGAPDPVVGARHLLEFEQRFDRMLGYPVQLRPIFQAIVEPLADQSRAKLGFALGDALVIADAYSRMLTGLRTQVAAHFQVVLDQIPPDVDRETLIQHLAGHQAGIATFGAAPVEENLAEVLGECTGVPCEEVAALITALATPLGSQPELATMNHTNTLRRQPIISLPDGRHLWALPDDFIHTALDWAAEVCLQDTDLIKVFDRRRQAACEQLTHQALAEVFGDEYVHQAATYPADGQRPDVDILVATPGATIVVEAKAGRFTDAARRGAPDRIKKKSREFIDKALDQNARTIAYLRNGAHDLRDRHRRRLTIPNSPHIVSVIVTLDRVDPFATHLPDGGKRGDVPDEGTWLVNLADLIMTTDLLRHPAEFYAYAELRARINKTGGPRIFVEADALGFWCEHRITPIASGPGELALLSTTSELMNDYYTFVPTSEHPDPPLRPTSGVPTEVLSAFDEVLHQHPEDWHNLTVEALAVPPGRWDTIRQTIKHCRDTRLSRRARKRTRRAASGIRLSDNLFVYVLNDDQADVGLLPTSLVIRRQGAAQ